MERIYDDIVAYGDLAYLLTYKLCQDPLEIFFGSLRASLGHKNNPNVLQFQGAYKRLLCGCFNKTEFGNCQWDDSTSILVQEPSVAVCIENVDEQFKVSMVEPPIMSATDEFKGNILIYTAGYIQRRIQATSGCDECVAVLTSTATTSAFIDQKDRGGLVRPNPDTVKIVETADKVLEEAKKTGNIFVHNHLFKKLNISTLSHINDKQPNIFKDLDNHTHSQHSSHKANIIKQIASLYFSIKLKHLAKLNNIQRNTLTRHKHKKAVIFQHE